MLQNLFLICTLLGGYFTVSFILETFQMQSKFSVDDKSHYLFTPKMLTEWTLGLLRYSPSSSVSVLEPWIYEGCRLFRDRLADDESKARFDAILSGILRSDWGDSSLLDHAKGWPDFILFSEESLPRGGREEYLARRYGI